MAGRELTISIKVGRRECVVALALFLIGLHPTGLSTEQLTLTTYYPSPYGVYQQLRSTQDSYLAYASGNVGIGTAAPGAKLDVTAPGGTATAFSVSGAGNITLTPAGNIGIGTTSPLRKLHLAGGGNSIVFDPAAGMMAVGTTDTSPIYGTGIKVANSNLHVQGNENGNWLRVGDAWSEAGIYAESGNLILGAASGRVLVGSNASQYLGGMCQSVWYSFGGVSRCPNSGTGWTVMSWGGGPGVISDLGTIPISGYMHCCKVETP